MKPIEIQNLDQHLKPLQVDGISTGIEISTEGLRFTGGTLEVENLISKKTDHEGDLTIQGDLYLQDTDGSTIYLVNGQSIDSKSTDDYITIHSKNILVNAATNFTDADCKFFAQSDSGYDSQISFLEGAGVNWSIGNDGSETPVKLSFSNSAVLGTDEKMSLDANGLLTVAGDIVAGDDIAVAATGKLSLDGVGGHTYIHEASSDDLEIVVGGKSMATFDEANGRVTMAAHKQTAALSDGTEFSATDSAYAGMILGYTRIFNLSSTSGHNVITVDNSSMTVLQTAQGTDVSVQFIVPPSGNVEIECTFWSSFVSRGAKFSLSDSATYNEIAFNYTYDADWTIYNDETDHSMHRVVFGVTGLTAGTNTTYYLAGLASSTYASILHGKNRIADEYYPPIIMKATALPATITTGE